MGTSEGLFATVAVVETEGTGRKAENYDEEMVVVTTTTVM